MLSLSCPGQHPGKRRAVLVANPTDADRELSPNLPDNLTTYLLDQDHFLTPVPMAPAHLSLNAYQTLLITDETVEM